MGKKSKWKKFRPTSNQELEDLLLKERKLQAIWYEKMSGAKPWLAGQKESMCLIMENLYREIDSKIKEMAVEALVSDETLGSSQ